MTHNLLGNINNQLSIKWPTNSPDSNSSISYNLEGKVVAGPKNDQFVYGDFPTKNTSLNGGSGEDSLTIHSTFEKALEALKNNNYSVETRPDGFALTGHNNQKFQIANIEKVVFNNQTFDLRCQDDVNRLIKAFECAGLNITNKTNHTNNNCGSKNGLTNPNYIPVFVLNNNGIINNNPNLYNNTAPQSSNTTRQPRIIMLNPNNSLTSSWNNGLSSNSSSNYWNTNSGSNWNTSSADSSNNLNYWNQLSASLSSITSNS